ncbi:unnamed protein product [Pleuronectes platessa]|uniref:Uncharacterized protein n=1 Tax=Pleuronectes platessa TaxID=8262 RepID=A0A9N7UXP2_PLEPL|nr:unnamed protein product [Pleuronectes platessa]
MPPLFTTEVKLSCSRWRDTIPSGVMGGRTQRWWILSLLILFSLLSLTQPIQVRNEEWELLGPDIAAMQRLRNLPEHMFHERLKDSSQQCDTGDRLVRKVD